LNNNFHDEMIDSGCEYINISTSVVNACSNKQSLSALFHAFSLIRDCLHNGNLVMCCGNGGSAADASHLTAEFVCRFETDRKGFRAIALTTDPQIITAVGNDLSYDQVFSRQVESIGRDGDILIIFSTSGNSKNCLEAAIIAKRIGINVVLFTGIQKGSVGNFADVIIEAQSARTAHIQEAHRVMYHLLCMWLDADPGKVA